MKILAIGDFHGKFPYKLKNKIKKEEVDLVIGLGDYTGLPAWIPIVMKQLRAGKKGEEIPSGEEIIGKKRYKELLKRDYAAGKKVLSELKKFNKPTIVIFGNGDWYEETLTASFKSYRLYIKKLKNLKEINRSKIKFKGITFIGFGGYMDIDAYFNKKEWKYDKDIKERIKRRKKNKKKLFGNLKKTKGERIFVFHYPPKGAFDIIRGGRANPMTGKSSGIGFFTQAIKKYKPRLVLCGHMHEYQGKKKIGKSLIVNPGAAMDGKAAVIDTETLEVRFFK